MEELVLSLKGVDWSFNGKGRGTDTHTLHPYPAKFIPQIPATILSIVRQLRTVDSVLDPFGGSGTTALEASKLNL